MMVQNPLSLFIATVLLLSSATAFGQDTEAQKLVDADDIFMEEVTVTARKREETLQDVPFSIAARTEGQIQRSGLTSLEDISQTVASFSVQNLGPGQSVVAIRGSSAGKQDRDLPGIKEQVGVYLIRLSIRYVALYHQSAGPGRCIRCSGTEFQFD